MTTDPLPTAADYADAIIIGRRAKNILFTLTLVLLVGQLTMFFLCRYKFPPDANDHRLDVIKYGIGLVDFIGVAAPIVLAIDLVFLTQIMIAGRLLGVARMLSAFLWTVVLLVLLFPWQAFLINQTFTSPEFKVPGVLYTWAEFVARVRVHPLPLWPKGILFWGRFALWPVAAILILVHIQLQSRRGINSAIGKSKFVPISDEPLPEPTPAPVN
jgi:hypothetical protein